MDSAGNDRAKSGFFVDNFSNHAHTNTRSKEGAKSAIDKVAQMISKSEKEEENYREEVKMKKKGREKRREDCGKKRRVKEERNF